MQLLTFERGKMYQKKNESNIWEQDKARERDKIRPMERKYVRLLMYADDHTILRVRLSEREFEPKTKTQLSSMK